MFRASSAHLQEDTVVYMQHMVLSHSMRVRGCLSLHSLSSHSSCVPTDHQKLSQRVTVPYSACAQQYPPEDEHLRLETCRGEYYFMNK